MKTFEGISGGFANAMSIDDVETVSENLVHLVPVR
jgi:hypothetical protein